MLELKSSIAFLLMLIALILVSSFVSFQFFNISAAENFCKNFSANFEFDDDKVSLEQGKGKLITINLTNTGFQNEFSMSLEGPKWVVVRPQILHLGTNERENVFVYMSPEFGVKGDFDIKLVLDALCVHRERTIKTSVQ